MLGVIIAISLFTELHQLIARCLHRVDSWIAFSLRIECNGFAVVDLLACVAHRPSCEARRNRVRLRPGREKRREGDNPTSFDDKRISGSEFREIHGAENLAQPPGLTMAKAVTSCCGPLSTRRLTFGDFAHPADERAIRIVRRNTLLQDPAPPKPLELANIPPWSDT